MNSCAQVHAGTHTCTCANGEQRLVFLHQLLCLIFIFVLFFNTPCVCYLAISYMYILWLHSRFISLLFLPALCISSSLLPRLMSLSGFVSLFCGPTAYTKGWFHEHRQVVIYLNKGCLPGAATQEYDLCLPPWQPVIAYRTWKKVKNLWALPPFVMVY